MALETDVGKKYFIPTPEFKSINSSALSLLHSLRLRDNPGSTGLLLWPFIISLLVGEIEYSECNNRTSHNRLALSFKWKIPLLQKKKNPLEKSVITLEITLYFKENYNENMTHQNLAIDKVA